MAALKLTNPYLVFFLNFLTCISIQFSKKLIIFRMENYYQITFNQWIKTQISNFLKDEPPPKERSPLNLHFSRILLRIPLACSVNLSRNLSPPSLNLRYILPFPRPRLVHAQVTEAINRPFRRHAPAISAPWNRQISRSNSRANGATVKQTAERGWGRVIRMH